MTPEDQEVFFARAAAQGTLPAALWKVLCAARELELRLERAKSRLSTRNRDFAIWEAEHKIRHEEICHQVDMLRSLIKIASEEPTDETD